MKQVAEIPADVLQRDYDRAQIVAMRLRRGPHAIYNLVMRGELRGTQQGGRWYVLRASVDEYVDRQARIAALSA